jgi:ParB/RepB/Spo0J family partition protein
METKDDKVVIQLPLGEISVDYSWNARSKRDVTAAQSDGVLNAEENMKEGGGFEGLCTSILANGQDSPIVVRKVGMGVPYELVCGFRRYTAVLKLNEKKLVIPGLKAGCIMAMVRELSPLDARLLNLRENTDRSNLTPPDLVWGILQLRGMKVLQIAKALNVSESYIYKLVKIADLPLPIVNHWRGDKVKLLGIPLALNGEPVPTRALSYPQILAIAETLSDDAEKMTMYVDATLGKKPPAMASSGDYSEEAVTETARMVAGLVLSGFLKPGSMQWAHVIGPKRLGFPIGCGKDQTASRLQKLWQLAQSVYEETINSKKEM